MVATDQGGIQLYAHTGSPMSVSATPRIGPSLARVAILLCRYWLGCSGEETRASEPVASREKDDAEPSVVSNC